jgi:hypothetical protein
MGDHPAASLRGLSRLSLPGRRIVVLRRNAEAEEGRRLGSAAGLRPAQLIATTLPVMPGLVPGIHVFISIHRTKDVDGRVKPGHDDTMKRMPE